jgi:hypothetical protein
MHSLDSTLNPLVQRDLSHVADITRETDMLSQYINLLNVLGVRLVTIQDTVRTQTDYHPELKAGHWVAQVLGLKVEELSSPSMATSQHLFLKAPRPFVGVRKEKDELTTQRHYTSLRPTSFGE